MMDEILALERKAGIHERGNTALRVKWIANLRKAVGESLPKNKAGHPVISDIDLLCATVEQRAKALGSTCPELGIELTHRRGTLSSISYVASPGESVSDAITNTMLQRNEAR